MSLRALNFQEDRINFGKVEAGTSAFNKAYDKFQANNIKSQTRHLLDMAQQEVN